MNETRVVLEGGGGASMPAAVLAALAREYAAALCPEELPEVPVGVLADGAFWDIVGAEWDRDEDPDGNRSDSVQSDSVQSDSVQREDGVAPLGDLSPDGLLDELQASWRAQAAAQARQAMLITELTMRRSENAVTELTGRHAKGKQAVSIASRGVVEEVRLELNLTRQAAGDLVDTSLGLCVENPDTLDQLARGEITWVKSELIVDLVQSLVMSQHDANGDLPASEQVDPEQLGRDLEAQMLKKAGRQTLPELRKAGLKAQIAANPRAAEFRHRQKRVRRRFWYSPDEDSMGRIGAYLPADQGIQTKNALTRLAHHARTEGDTRTLDQLRVDTLVSTITKAADNLHPGAGEDAVWGCQDDDLTAEDGGDASADAAPTSANNRAKHTPPRKTPAKNHSRGRNGSSNPRVVITIGASTLTGDDDQPAHLQGHGPIIASMARQVAATGTWQCAITDDIHGTLLGLGRSTYTPNYEPTQALRDHLITRDRVCRVKGCNQPADTSDVDHRIPWPQGPTCECNTGGLCGNDHRLKHEGGFTLTPSTDPADPPGTLIWTTPAGRSHPSYPAVLNDPKPFTPNGSPVPAPPGEPGDDGDCHACAKSKATIADEAQWENSAQNAAPTGSIAGQSTDTDTAGTNTGTGFVDPLPPSTGPVRLCLGTTFSTRKPWDHYAHAVRLGWPRRPIRHTGPDYSDRPLFQDGPPPF